MTALAADSCEKCGGRGEVLETRRAGPFRRRRYTCLKCDTRWTTYERRSHVVLREEDDRQTIASQNPSKTP